MGLGFGCRATVWDRFKFLFLSLLAALIGSITLKLACGGFGKEALSPKP